LLATTLKQRFSAAHVAESHAETQAAWDSAMESLRQHPRKLVLCYEDFVSACFLQMAIRMQRFGQKAIIATRLVWTPAARHSASQRQCFQGKGFFFDVCVRLPKGVGRCQNAFFVRSQTTPQWWPLWWGLRACLLARSW
jgi:hypothetical protein